MIEPNCSVFRERLRAVGFIKAVSREITLKIAIVLSITATYVGQALAMGGAVSVIFTGGGPADILAMLAAAVGCVIGRSFLQRMDDVYSKITAVKVKSRIGLLLNDKLLSLGPGGLNSQRSGELLSLMTDGVESLEPFLVYYIPQLITVVISSMVIGTYLFSLDPATGAAALGGMALCIILPYISGTRASSITLEYWRAYSNLNAQYVDAIQGMATLKAFNASCDKGRELAADAWNFYRKATTSTTYSLLDSSLIVLLMALTSSLTSAVGAWRTELGLISPASLSIIFFLSLECARPMANLNIYWHNSFLALAVSGKMLKFLNSPSPVISGPKTGESSLDSGVPPSINFENVSFSYDRQVERAVLENINFKCEPGQTTAVVGRSGTGKTTLVNLLVRFHQPDSGRISINGTPIEDFSLSYLRDKISVVFQDTYIFSGTLEDNFRVARSDASYNEIISAAKAANIHDFISSLPNGYQTLVGERGITLSGGQRQRLAIARAVLKNAPILILDEATSNVDNESEQSIIQALESLRHNRTTIIIAHRLSTIEKADKILVIECGRLAESGAMEDLLASNGIFARLAANRRQPELV